jgi:lipid-A-disaccharide synthase
MPDALRIFISAGEASGEAYGALLIHALKKRLKALNREAHFFGMGGPRMAEAGLDRIVRAEDMAVMGITEVVRHLPRIYREFRRLKRSIRERRPALAILIDFPDIHFKLAEKLHRLGIPVLFFVSPQLWAWKKHRIKLVRKFVDRMLVIFPFEESFYRERGVLAEFVGHPLADLPLPTISRELFAAENKLDPEKIWIALLPGSRAKEIHDNLPEMLAAANLLAASGVPSNSSGNDLRTEGKGRGTEARSVPGKGTGFSPYVGPLHENGALAPAGIQFIVPLAPTLNPEHIRMVGNLIGQLAPNLAIRLVNDRRTGGAVGPTAGGALFHARASIVASGTATVEAALIGNPFVVVYRVSPITYAIAKRFVTVPHVAMANLIAGKRMVPELIQNDFTAANIVQQLEPLLPDGPPRQSMMQELQRVRGLLSTTPSGEREAQGAIDRVAAVALGYLGVPSPVAESVQS